MLDALVDVMKNLGATNGSLFLMARFLDKISFGRARLVRYQFVAQPVSMGAAFATAGKLVVRRAYQADPLLLELPRPPGVIERRFREGHVCFVAEVAGRLAGCLWLAEDFYLEDEVRCCYRWEDEAAAAWDYDVYIRPDHRLSRAFMRLWQTAHQYLTERGVRRTFSRISAFNPASLSAHRRLGATKIGTGTFLIAGPVQFAFFSFWPFVHFSAGGGAVPQLDLSLASPYGQTSHAK